MTTVSREELHDVIEQLPEDRLTAAAELLQSLTLNDRRAAVWRQTLSPTDESEIAASLRREYAAGEWVTDELVGEWIDSVGGSEAPPPSSRSSADA